MALYWSFLLPSFVCLAFICFNQCFLNDLGDQMKAAERRMKDISELQRQIGTYGKTQEIYAQYRKLTGRKKEKFYEQHSSEITACQAAKQYFNSLGLKKLPSMQSLKQEYAVLQAEKKKRYPEYLSLIHISEPTRLID